MKRAARQTSPETRVSGRRLAVSVQRSRYGTMRSRSSVGEVARPRAHPPGTAQRPTRSPTPSASSPRTRQASSTARSCLPTAAGSPSNPPNETEVSTAREAQHDSDRDPAPASVPSLGMQNARATPRPLLARDCCTVARPATGSRLLLRPPARPEQESLVVADRSSTHLVVRETGTELLNAGQSYLARGTGRLGQSLPSTCDAPT